MGWDFIDYDGDLEQFSDFDLWTLRHFLIAASTALAAAQPCEDASELRLFFERWDWPGPGVFIGTDFSSFVQRSHRRWELLFQALEHAADRIADFGDAIPVSYLTTHVNTFMARWTAPQPTKRFLADIGRICKLLSRHEPPIV
jgi:hypothetical protein